MKRETLNKFHELADGVEAQKNLASELLKTAKDRYSHVIHKINRKGQEVEIDEKTLWEEVYHLGFNCDAGKELEKAHPEVFEAFRKQDQLADELWKFGIEELGVNYRAMTLSDYLKMTEGLFKLLIEESK